MSRLPPLPRDELTPEQQEFQDHFVDSVKHHSHPGAVERASKNFFPFLSVLPRTGRCSVDMLTVLNEEAVGLPDDARETISLVCNTYFKCAYATFAHKNAAVKLGLLTPEQAETCVSGDKPKDFNDACSLAYDATHYMLYVRGPLPQEMWDKCIQAFGLKGTVGLTHYVALHAWTSLGLNACNVPAPPAPPQ